MENDVFANFNPRTPCGVRPMYSLIFPLSSEFQSTHPLRGATLLLRPCLRFLSISIHAPLAGCDDFYADSADVQLISIHAPLAGCDSYGDSDLQDLYNFNPRTPCGVRRSRQTRLHRKPGISIHAPLAGCDTSRTARRKSIWKFQSTHPLRGATRARQPAKQHADDFNPRTPCGVRQAKPQRWQ